MKLLQAELELNGVKAVMNYRAGTHDDVVFSEIWGNNPFYIPYPDYDVREGYQIVDIGGHIGTYTVYALLKGANVLTFEPMPDAQKLIIKNVKATGKQKNHILIKAGVWNEVCDKEMITSEYETGSNSLLSNIFTDGGKFKVLLVNPNPYLNLMERIDILKVDCEGSEYTFFETITEENLNKVNRIVMETHLGFDKGKELLRWLQTKGFLTYMIEGLDGTAKTWAVRGN